MLALIAATLLGIFQLMMSAAAATSQRGKMWNTSSRDAVVPPLIGKAGRIDRAFKNYKESFSFFVAAILLVIVSGKTGQVSAIASLVYVGARIIYVPLYVFDITVVRSLVWIISASGIIGVLVQMFI